MRFQLANKHKLPPKSPFGLRQGLAMKKTIKGLVTGIIDGNTFELSIPLPNGHSDSEQKYTEIVRIDGMDKPAVSTLPGILAKLELEKMIVGRTLECEILSRNDQDQAIARVPNKYFQSPFTFVPREQP